MFQQYFKTAKINGISFGVALNMLSVLKGIQGGKEEEMFNQEMVQYYYELPVFQEQYTIVTWPEVQELMEEPWFAQEAELINSEIGLQNYGPGAYFVPTTRLI